MDFTGSVAVVTGAGHGLGRSYALELAARGARVVVDDIPLQADGSSGTGSPADDVVAEIVAAGGVAVAERTSVATADGGAAVVQRALDEFGDLDVLINNAGIGRAKPFADVTYEDVTASLSVHLLGAFHTVMPAWQHFLTRGGGRIVNTTSAVGMFGQRRSAVYAAAKMGVVGLTRVLAQEGAEHGIRVNAIAPVAQSRMAGEVYGRLDPKLPAGLVTAVVLALAHQDCPVTGQVVSAGGGRMARLFVAAADGHFSPTLDADEAAAHLAEVCAEEEPVAVPVDAMAEIDLIRQCYPELAGFRMQHR
jgi:NAD(P)-dependent dehydrogenase (short-subunit alcohol dehydrogenase family)